MSNDEKQRIIKNEIIQKRTNIFYIKYPDLYKEIHTKYPQLSGYPFIHKAYWYINNINDFPVCVVCGKKNIRKIRNIGKGYLNDCCSASCTCKHPNTLEKRKKTYMKKYGVESPLQSKEIYKKWKRTCLERYNADSPFGSKQIQEKIKNTCLEKYGMNTPNAQEWKRDATRQSIMRVYGVSNVSLIQNIKDKKKQTCISNYGVDVPLKSDIVKDKVKQTCLEKYGVINPLQLEEFREKSKQTCLEKYGVEYVSQTSEFQERVYYTKKRHKSFHISKPEQKAHQLLLTIYPDIIGQYKSKEYPFNCDFYIPSINTYIELHFSWMHGGEPYTNTIKQQNKANEWLEKSHELNFRGKNKISYLNAFKTWTIKDPMKKYHAEKNKLNWLCFYKKGSFLAWFDKKNKS